MPQVALKIPPVFHVIFDTSVESLCSLIPGAAALLLRGAGNCFRIKLTGAEILCSELRNPFAFVADTYAFNLGCLGLVASRTSQFRASWSIRLLPKRQLSSRGFAGVLSWDTEEKMRGRAYIVFLFLKEKKKEKNRKRAIKQKAFPKVSH